MRLEDFSRPQLGARDFMQWYASSLAIRLPPHSPSSAKRRPGPTRPVRCMHSDKQEGLPAWIKAIASLGPSKRCQDKVDNLFVCVLSGLFTHYSPSSEFSI